MSDFGIQKSSLRTTLVGNPDLIKNSGIDNPPQHPLELLTAWFETAFSVGVVEPCSMTLATVNENGCPSARVLLLKDFDERGLLFATCHNSNKGKDLEINPNAACNLWWRESMQQINFQGVVRKLPSEESDRMFNERVHSARATVSISQQSAELTDEAQLRQQVADLIAQGGEIERPEHWHGYVLELRSVEFWHGSRDRFHRRLRYDLADGVWSHKRLQP